MLQIIRSKEFIPIIAGILTGIIGYCLGMKKQKTDQFYKNINESLQHTLSPIFHDIRKLKRITNEEEKEKSITDFFKKYTSESSKIYKLGNLYILSYFYEMEDLYYTYLKKRSEESWKTFWLKFESFHIMSNDEYWKNCSILYYDYKWLRSLSRRNYLLKFIFELIGFLYETTTFLIILLLFFIYVILMAKFTGNPIIPSEYIQITITLLSPILALWGFLIIINSDYITSRKMQKEKGILRKILENKFPRFIEFWDESPSPNKKKIMRDKEIPNMYKKKTF